MRLTNETPHPADLFRSNHERDVMYNALVSRVRYRLGDDQPLVVETGPGKLRDLRRAPFADAYGEFTPDQIYGRIGTDLIILGDAGAPEGPAASVDVRVLAGAYDLSLRIHGERVWERRFGVGGLHPSAPTHFTTLPLTYSNAFGGHAPIDLGSVPCADNPEGKGFYLHEADAAGKPLANIENLRAPVKTWDDRPDPVATAPYPRRWALRLSKSLIKNETSGKYELAPGTEFFNCAHPLLSGKPLVTGDWVRLAGFAVGRSMIGFRLPACPLVAEIQLGTKVHLREPSLEEVLIDLRSGHVDLTYRKMFHYPIRARQLRRITLRLKASA